MARTPCQMKGNHNFYNDNIMYIIASEIEGTNYIQSQKGINY